MFIGQGKEPKSTASSHKKANWKNTMVLLNLVNLTIQQRTVFHLQPQFVKVAHRRPIGSLFNAEFTTSTLREKKGSHTIPILTYG